jgi:iron complex outermembrane recepter protein
MKQQFNNKQCATALKAVPISALLATLLSSAIPFKNAAAQNSNPNPTLIVSGSRFEENLNEVPANVKVITRDEIENSSSNTIPQVLSQIGGLRVRGVNAGTLNLDATVDMGGFGPTASSSTLILIDGIRINPIDSSSIDWGSIPIDSVERIEIVQGGAGVQYGNGAVGGVINIITNGGKKNINQASTTYGSWGTLINNVILKNTVDKTTYQISANTSNTNGWRANTAANAYSVDAKISQSLGGNDRVFIDAFYGYTNSQLAGPILGVVGTGNPRALDPKRPFDAGKNLTVKTSGFRQGLTKSINSQYTVEFDSSYSKKSSFFYTPQADYDIPQYGAYGIQPLSNNLDGWQVAASPRIKANFGSFGTSVFGYDYSKANQAGIGSYTPLAQSIILANQTPGLFYNGLTNNTQNATQINQSIYLIQRIPLTSTIEASGGFRRQMQQASTSSTAINASNGTATNNQQYAANAGDVALNFNYLPGQRVYVKWNQSFRFPNIDEYWGVSFGTAPPFAATTVFNGIIQPQTTQTYELGGSWSVLNSKITSSIFRSSTQNEISYNPATGANYNSIYQIDRNGFLLDIASSLSKSLSVAAGGKYQKSFYANGPFSGNAIPIAPNTLLNARANYALTPNAAFGGVINYVSEQYYDAAPNYFNASQMMPSYVVADVYASYRYKDLEGRFTIKNVGGAQYATYGTGKGAFSSVSYYPSEPRSYFVNVRYNFK